MRNILISVLLMLVSFSLWWVSNFQLSSLIDPTSLLMVVVMVSSGTLFLTRYSAIHWAEALWCLGLTAGLIGTCTGLLHVSLGMDPIAFIGAWPILIIVALYGALISAIGYFSLTDAVEAKTAHKDPTLYHFIFLVLLPFVSLFVYFGFLFRTTFISIPALAVFSSIFALATVLKKKVSLRDISEIGLLGSIFCLVLALIAWYSNEINSTNFALTGLLYGLLIHMLSYIASPLVSDSPANKLDVGKGNWHWIEVSAFMLFMLFAPETLRESLVNESQDESQNKEMIVLKSRLNDLEHRLGLPEED